MYRCWNFKKIIYMLLSLTTFGSIFHKKKSKIYCWFVESCHTQCHIPGSVLEDFQTKKILFLYFRKYYFVQRPYVMQQKFTSIHSYTTYLIQQQYPRVHDQGSSYGNSLFLTTRQSYPSLPHHSVVPILKPCNKLMRVGFLRYSLNL